MNSIRRPTEEEALALVTMTERLARMTPVQWQTVVLNASGYTQRDIARMRGQSQQMISQYFHEGLEACGED